jgi:predicted dehydrogenase
VTIVNSSNTLRVAVLGCGYWGSKHARVLQGLESVQSLVVVDSDPERVRRICTSLPGAVGFTSLDDVLDDIDAAVVATPPTMHASMAMQLIDAGKHVLVEKPMAAESADARRMIAAAEARDVVLMVGHTFEYHSAVWMLRDMIQAGDLGDLYYVDSARLNLGLYQSDVNVIYDLAPHDISIFNHILGSKPTAVNAWASRNAHPFLEDVAYLRLYYSEPDVCANIHVSWLDPYKVRRVTVVGSKKMVVYNDLAADERIRVHDKGVSHESDGNDTQPPMSYRYGDVISPYFTVNEPLKVEDQHFTDCVISGERPQTDGESGLAVVEVLEAAQRSLREGRSVALADRDGARRHPRQRTAPEASALVMDGIRGS